MAKKSLVPIRHKLKNLTEVGLSDTYSITVYFCQDVINYSKFFIQH